MEAPANDPGTAALFKEPAGIAVDSSGNIYVGDNYNHLVRKIDPDGNVTTLAGQAGVSGSADSQGTDASFNRPHGVAVDSLGNVYVADFDNHLIRKIDPSGNVTTLADSFYHPIDVAVDSLGNVYVADFYNHLIRKIDPSGNVTILAGQAGNPGSADGPGTTASFNGPGTVAVDSLGNLFVGDAINHLIRKIDPSVT